MAILFGLFTALGFGVGDFLAGLASRRIDPLRVIIMAQLVGGSFVLAAAGLSGGHADFAAVAWGGAAGLALGGGFIFYLRAFAMGQMGLVAAVTGVWSAAMPFAVALLLGDRPGVLAMAGALAAMGAIALVSLRRPAPSPEGVPGGGARGLRAAAIAGLLFGLFFVCLDQASGGHPLWPAASASFSSIIPPAVIAILSPRQPHETVHRSLRLIAAIGVFQAIGTIAFILAVREGMLSLVAVAGALSPIPTALCAFIFLQERLNRAQISGLMLAVLGVILLVLT